MKNSHFNRTLQYTYLGCLSDKRCIFNQFAAFSRIFCGVGKVKHRNKESNVLRRKTTRVVLTPGENRAACIKSISAKEILFPMVPGGNYMCCLYSRKYFLKKTDNSCWCLVWFLESLYSIFYQKNQNTNVEQAVGNTYAFCYI